MERGVWSFSSSPSLRSRFVLSYHFDSFAPQRVCPSISLSVSPSFYINNHAIRQSCNKWKLHEDTLSYGQLYGLLSCFSFSYTDIVPSLPTSTSCCNRIMCRPGPLQGHSSPIWGFTSPPLPSGDAGSSNAFEHIWCWECVAKKNLKNCNANAFQSYKAF